MDREIEELPWGNEELLHVVGAGAVDAAVGNVADVGTLVPSDIVLVAVTAVAGGILALGLGVSGGGSGVEWYYRQMGRIGQGVQKVEVEIRECRGYSHNRHRFCYSKPSIMIHLLSYRHRATHTKTDGGYPAGWVVNEIVGLSVQREQCDWGYQARRMLALVERPECEGTSTAFVPVVVYVAAGVAGGRDGEENVAHYHSTADGSTSLVVCRTSSGER